MNYLEDFDSNDEENEGCTVLCLHAKKDDTKLYFDKYPFLPYQAISLFFVNFIYKAIANRNMLVVFYFNQRYQRVHHCSEFTFMWTKNVFKKVIFNFKCCIALLTSIRTFNILSFIVLINSKMRSPFSSRAPRFERSEI